MPTNTVAMYTATKSLDVEYTFNYCIAENTSVVVPAADIHAKLYAGCTELFSKADTMYKVDFSKINFATAAFTFLHTDTTTEEGSLGDDVEQKTFFLNANTHRRIMSSINFNTDTYNQVGVTGSKSTRDRQFNRLLTNRESLFFDIADQYWFPPDTITNITGLNNAIANPMFHEKFHHSEQAIMHFLSSAIGIQSLVSTAVSCDMAYLYGIVLDIFTQRDLCSNCNASLLGLQHSQQQGLLYDLSQSLEMARIQPRVNENLMLNTRVSAVRASKNGTLDALTALIDDKDKNTCHFYDPDADNKVFQAKNTALGTRKIIKDNHYSLKSYPGTFFTSSNVDKAKLEAAIKLPAVALC